MILSKSQTLKIKRRTLKSSKRTIKTKRMDSETLENSMVHNKRRESKKKVNLEILTRPKKTKLKQESQKKMKLMDLATSAKKSRKSQKNSKLILRTNQTKMGLEISMILMMAAYKKKLVRMGTLIILKKLKWNRLLSHLLRKWSSTARSRRYSQIIKLF